MYIHESHSLMLARPCSRDCWQATPVCELLPHVRDIPLWYKHVPNFTRSSKATIADTPPVSQGKLFLLYLPFSKKLAPPEFFSSDGAKPLLCPSDSTSFLLYFPAAFTQSSRCLPWLPDWLCIINGSVQSSLSVLVFCHSFPVLNDLLWSPLTLDLCVQWALTSFYIFRGLIVPLLSSPARS